MNLIEFKNLPDTSTPINAENLNNNFNVLNDNISNMQPIYNLIASGEAVKTGYKVDSKDVWVKRIYCGLAPTSSNPSTTDTGLSNITYLSWNGVCAPQGGSWPEQISGIAEVGSVRMAIEDNKVKITTSTDNFHNSGYYCNVNIYFIYN